MSRHCDQCDFLFINGIGCHEFGCPNAAREKREQENEERNEDDASEIDFN